ncbi:GTPase RhebL1-like [Aquarana catesbeiana]|uniref:GTPase RhebL1-like n=1 Tax=Aquarana catesbeiana TaxID=8400 RepID=UPI003CCA30DB
MDSFSSIVKGTSAPHISKDMKPMKIKKIAEAEHWRNISQKENTAAIGAHITEGRALEDEDFLKGERNSIRDTPHISILRRGGTPEEEDFVKREHKSMYESRWLRGASAVLVAFHSDIVIVFCRVTSVVKVIMAMAKYRKVVILGHQAVGKTSLTLQFLRQEFPQVYHPTIENVWKKTFSLGLAEYELDVVDTASQMEFSYIPQSLISGVDGYIVVYSVDSFRSFQIAGGLYRKLEAKRGRRRMPIVLVGNKKDIPAQRRHVTHEDGKRLAENWNAPFIEVSAKDSEECKEVFTKIIEEIDGVPRLRSLPPTPDEGRKRCIIL